MRIYQRELEKACLMEFFFRPSNALAFRITHYISKALFLYSAFDYTHIKPAL